MDGTGELFKPLVDALVTDLDTTVVPYPADEVLRYEELVNLVTSRIPKEKPYFILGESFSGPLAVMAASRSGENLLGIILVATFVKSPMPRWISRFKRLLRGPFLDMRPRPFIIQSLLGKGCPEKTRKWIIETLPRLKKEVLAARIEAVLEVNVREELKNCKAPVLYIAGSRDWLVNRKSLDAVWLCRPDVEIKVLEGGHMILQTNPAEAAGVILQFCEGQWSPPAARADHRTRRHGDPGTRCSK